MLIPPPDSRGGGDRHSIPQESPHSIFHTPGGTCGAGATVLAVAGLLGVEAPAAQAPLLRQLTS